MPEPALTGRRSQTSNRLRASALCPTTLRAADSTTVVRPSGDRRFAFPTNHSSSSFLGGMKSKNRGSPAFTECVGLMTSTPPLPSRNPGTKETDSVLARALPFCGEVDPEASYGHGSRGTRDAGGEKQGWPNRLCGRAHTEGDTATSPWSLSGAASSPGTGRPGPAWAIQRTPPQDDVPGRC